MQSQGRKPDDCADQAGEHPSLKVAKVRQPNLADAEPWHIEIERKQADAGEGYALRLQIGRRIGANSQEGSVAKRALTRKSRQNHQGDANDGVDEHKYELALQVGAQYQWRQEQQAKQQPV